MLVEERGGRYKLKECKMSSEGMWESMKHQVEKENWTGQRGELGSCIRILDHVLYTLGSGSLEAFY